MIMKYGAPYNEPRLNYRAEAKKQAKRERRLRELEWAANYVLHNEKRRCRCAGRCDRCKPWNEAKAKLAPEVILELIEMIREQG